MSQSARVQVEHLIRVTIRGQDNKLIAAFLNWVLDNGLHPASPAISRVGFYTALFPKGNTADIEEWIEKNSAGVATEEH